MSQYASFCDFYTLQSAPSELFFNKPTEPFHD